MYIDQISVNNKVKVKAILFKLDVFCSAIIASIMFAFLIYVSTEWSPLSIWDENECFTSYIKRTNFQRHSFQVCKQPSKFYLEGNFFMDEVITKSDDLQMLQNNRKDVLTSIFWK